MAYDGLTMAAICRELQPLIDARIEKIYQPRPEIIILHLRQRDGGKFRLLLSAEAANPGIHLTDYPLANPEAPPMFCMLLRKYLEGGRILAITQVGLERVLTITITTYNELREPCQRQLHCEVMGKHSNIILVDPDNELILDGLKRYTHAVSRHREVLPGGTYLPPPQQNKLDPRFITEELLTEGILAQLDQPISKALINLLAGVSPLLAKELLFRANLPPEIKVDECGVYELHRLFAALQTLTAELAHHCPRPSLIKGPEGATAYSAFNLTQFPEENIFHLPSVNTAVDHYFRHQEGRRLFQGLAQKLNHRINKELERCYKKASLQEDTVLFAREADQYRIKGEILTANLFRLTPGQSQVELENFYDPAEQTISIELLPELTPNENAQRYFRRYNKAKNAAQKALIHYRQTREEIMYLEGVQSAVAQATVWEELEDIKDELIKQKYLRETERARAKAKQKAKPQPLTYYSSDGFTFLVGKNNRQNDYLTLRVARDQDLWFHTKDLPGSHVILVNPGGQPPPPQTLKEGAALAAYYSKGREGSKVPVDYTEKKHVRKPAGAKPGMVIYDHHQTIYITPEAEIIKKIQANQP